MKKNILKKAISFILSLIIAFGSVLVVYPSQPVKAYGMDSGIHTGSTTAPYLDTKIGTSRQKIINELIKNKKLYNRTGFAASKKPYFTRENTMVIGKRFNCTGFVMTALERSGADLNKISSPSGGYKHISNLNRFSRYVVLDKRAKSYKFKSVSALLNSGKAEKGDIIIMQPMDWSVGYKDSHVGFFWGNHPKDNKFWHHTITHGNAITHIFGYVTNPVYYLVKLRPGNGSNLPTATARIDSITSNYEAISGIKFQLLDENKKAITVKGYSSEGYRKTKTGGIYMYTNSNGYAEIKNLPAGQYYIRQINELPMYKKRTTDRPMYISQTTTKKTAYIYNERKAGTAVIKSYTDNDVSLRGLNFELLDSNKKPVKMRVTSDYRYRFYKEGTKSSVWTDENGYTSITNLPIGKYYLKQLNSKNGFIKEKDYIPFTIETDKTSTTTVINPRESASLVVSGQNDKQMPLDNIKLQLLDEDKNVVNLSIVGDYRYKYNPNGDRTVFWLDRTGVSKISGLAKGKYYIRQLSTHLNHEMIMEDIEINITDFKEYSHKILNNQKPNILKGLVDKIVMTIM